LSSNFNALYAHKYMMNKSIIVIVVLILVFLFIGVKFFNDEKMVSAGDDVRTVKSTTASTPTSTAMTVPSGIVNTTKKVTGETSHKKRVNFGTHADVLKYSPDTGKNLAFNKVKVRDHSVGAIAKKVARNDAEKAIISSVLAEDSVEATAAGAIATAASATSIEDIILGTLMI